MIDLARGALIIFGERGEFAGKPRPGVVIQRSSTLADSPTVCLCGLTTTDAGFNPARVPLMPSSSNRLHAPSWVMIDKISSISRERIGKVVGALQAQDMEAIDLALRRWLNL